MKKEIEHKFLIDPARLPKLPPGRHLTQGYLNTRPTVRVRLEKKGKSARAFLTIKGPGLISRDEYEYAIPPSDARGLLKLCGERTLEKTRHDFHGWEIDQFHGRHAGLWLAEYELNSPRHKLPKLPDWIGEDVTDKPEFSNSALAAAGIPPRSGAKKVAGGFIPRLNIP